MPLKAISPPPTLAKKPSPHNNEDVTNEGNEGPIPTRMPPSSTKGMVQVEQSNVRILLRAVFNH
jgi:hypothetical protein